MRRVELFDTTLRDGAQAKGISFSLSDRLAIVKALDKLGVDYIEGGTPFANPKEAAFFEAIRETELEHARVVAFGMTCHKSNPPQKDKGLSALLKAGTEIITVFGKASFLHAEKILGVTAEENLRLIAESIRYLSRQGKTVFFDAEHFFDGFRLDEGYATAVLETARDNGAARLVLCDTNGGTLSREIGAVTERVCRRFDGVGIHCHNDSDMATAASVEAVLAGAGMVQGTLLGFGERCGNANLAVVASILKLKLGIDCLSDEQLKRLTPTVNEVAGVANYRLRSETPFIGKNAFSHKAGTHIDGVLKYSSSFEHVDPETIGNTRRLLLSEEAGKSAVKDILARRFPGTEKDPAKVDQVLRRLKELENEGYFFEDALSSFDMMVSKCLGTYRPHFELQMFNVSDEFAGNELDEHISYAIIKIRVSDQTKMTAAEGNGPVNALDLALRKALKGFYPELNRVSLVDYKVRVLDNNVATAARVRVSIDWADGEKTWTTVGVSTDVIAASLLAIMDSIEFTLMTRPIKGASDED